jgi:excisionase family DNA binding protein
MATANSICVTRKKAAALLDCSEQMVSKLIKTGQLPATYLGTAVRIRVADLEAVLEPYNTKKPRGARVPRKRRVQ